MTTTLDYCICYAMGAHLDMYRFGCVWILIVSQIRDLRMDLCSHLEHCCDMKQQKSNLHGGLVEYVDRVQRWCDINMR